jgi:hypothetical protein
MTITVTVPAEMSFDNTVHVYTDDSDPLTGLDSGGHVERMIPCVKDIVSVADYVVNLATGTAQDAIDSAASAAAAANSAATLTATSTTSTLIGTGSKTFTTQSGKQFQAGQTLKIVSQANSNNYMTGTVTSYSTTSLVFDVALVGGSGTFADWNISVSGIQGATGAAGANTTATNVTNTPAGGISATNVQAALNELDTEKFSRGKILFLIGR